MKSLRQVLGIALAATLYAGSGLALAQKDAYPNKPIRLIVPFLPGGGTDLVGRSLAQKLSESYKQTVIVDNRPGGGSTIGTEIGIRANPDGYTLLMLSGSYATSPGFYKLSYDPIKDITPVSLIGEAGFLFVVYPGVPAKNIKELIALARSKPGSLNYGSAGVGAIVHLGSALFDMMAGVKTTHIPYKGNAGAMNDLLGGHIQYLLGSMPNSVPHVKTGRLRGIAVTDLKRNPAVPDVPTVNESGVPGYEVTNWYAVAGPRNLPKDIVANLNQTSTRIVKTPEMQERMAAEGVEPRGGPPELMLDVVKRNVVKWAKVVKDANITIQP